MDDIEFFDCPEILGETRCLLPAEVVTTYWATSSDGPVLCAKIECPLGHRFNGALDSLRA